MSFFSFSFFASVSFQVLMCAHSQAPQVLSTESAWQKTTPPSLLPLSRGKTYGVVILQESIVRKEGEGKNKFLLPSPLCRGLGTSPKNGKFIGAEQVKPTDSCDFLFLGLHGLKMKGLREHGAKCRRRFKKNRRPQRICSVFPSPSPLEY